MEAQLAIRLWRLLRGTLVRCPRSLLAAMRLRSPAWLKLLRRCRAGKWRWARVSQWPPVYPLGMSPLGMSPLGMAAAAAAG